MLILHENIYIYRRACPDKIPTLGQFLHGQMGIFQILLSHSSKIQYIGQNQEVLHFFIVTNWHILTFLRLLGSNKGSLKCAGKSKFLDESYPLPKLFCPLFTPFMSDFFARLAQHERNFSAKLKAIFCKTQ